MTRRILVIDDSPEFLKLMELLLSRAGYTPLLAEGALDAMQLLAGELPDAILLDIMMPLRNGLELLEDLRWEDRYGNVPVIVVTAMTLSAEEREFVDAFANACVDKARSADIIALLREQVPPA